MTVFCKKKLEPADELLLDLLQLKMQRHLPAFRKKLLDRNFEAFRFRNTGKTLQETANKYLVNKERAGQIVFRIAVPFVKALEKEPRPAWLIIYCRYIAGVIGPFLEGNGKANCRA